MEGLGVGLVFMGLVGMLAGLIGLAGGAIQTFGLVTTLGLLTLVVSTFIIIGIFVICINVYPFVESSGFWEWYW